MTALVVGLLTIGVVAALCGVGWLIGQIDAQNAFIRTEKSERKRSRAIVAAFGTAQLSRYPVPNAGPGGPDACYECGWDCPPRGRCPHCGAM